MNLNLAIEEHVLSALRGIDTCMVSNAIETFDVRLRNAGFADARIQCMFKDLLPMVGYSATARLRAGDPPMLGRIPVRRNTKSSSSEPNRNSGNGRAKRGLVREQPLQRQNEKAVLFSPDA
jgi:hypothetical protein